MKFLKFSLCFYKVHSCFARTVSSTRARLCCARVLGTVQAKRTRSARHAAIVLTAFMASSMSCKEKDKPEVHPEPTLSVSPAVTDIVFSTNGKTATADGKDLTNLSIMVETNQKEWDAKSSDETWLTAIKSGNRFILTAKAVTGIVAPNAAVVTVTAGDAKPLTINVRQTANTPFLRVEPELLRAIEFSANGLIATSGGVTVTRTLTVTTNAGTWKAESDQEWLTVEESANTFGLTAKANTNTAPPPPATVTVRAGAAGLIDPVTITATQAGYDLIPVTGIAVTGSALVDGKLTLDQKGKTTSLTATLLPENHNEQGVNNTIRWKSSNDAIATVSSTGTVTAIGGGDAIITAFLERKPEIEKNIPVNVFYWENITANVLQNTQAPFKTVGAAVIDIQQGGTGSRRYFMADVWKTNAQGGANGNVFVRDDGAFHYHLCFSAWDDPVFISAAITKGKLYQPVELEAGKYRFTAYVNLSYGIHEVYVTAVSGNAETSGSEDDVLARVRITSGLPLGENLPVTIEFEVPKKGIVSLGFLANLANSEVYFNKVELWKIVGSQ